VHRISHLSIVNYRACRNVSLPLDGYTPLVGQNNTGKSTILEALQWVLKPTALKACDFSDAAKPVVVSACIEGITTDLLDRIPEPKHRKSMEPYCRDGKLWIRVEASGTGTKSFSKKVWNVENYSGEEMPVVWRDYPTGLPEAVSVLLPDPLYIQAMQDVGEDLGKAKSGSTIKNLLDEIMEPILKAHEDLNGALNTIRSILTSDGDKRSGHLKDFDQKASEALADFFPGLSLDLDLQIVDVKEFFKAGDLHVTDKMTGDRRRFDQIGTGAQRSIQMALIRHLAEARAAKPQRTARRLLLIDEPELYLHPQGVRRLRQALANLAQSGFQVVFSSHSPLMLSRENAADTVIVSKHHTKGTETRKPLRKAVEDALDEAQSQSRTLFELGNLAEIYFAERVVLCEGKTDRRILPLVYERLYNQNPELDRITFVSLGSCADIPKAIPVLKSMGIKVCVVADLDFAFTHARNGNKALLPKDGDDLKQAKSVLQRIQPVHGFTLSDNGLPTNDKKSGCQAADVWAHMVKDEEGLAVAQTTHDALKDKAVWVWLIGCIEQVAGVTAKGECAIIEQEERLRGLSAEEIDKEMPAFKHCFDWIRSL